MNMKTDIMEIYSKMGLTSKNIANSSASNKNADGKNFFAVLQDFNLNMKKEAEELKKMAAIAKKQREQEKKTLDDQRKAILIANKIRKGQRVSADEVRFLMEVDLFGYIFAMMSQSAEKDKDKYEDILKKNKSGEISNEEAGEMVETLNSDTESATEISTDSSVSANSAVSVSAE
jgi:hypothetical protein